MTGEMTGGVKRRALVLASLGTVLAMRQRLPADFGGFLHGTDNIARDCITFKGTALSAPLSMLFAQAVCMVLATQRNAAGRPGIIGLTLLGTAQVLGQLGEPIAYRALRPSSFVPMQAAIVVGNLILDALVVVAGSRVWRAQ